jgi:hypothetical protein
MEPSTPSLRASKFETDSDASLTSTVVPNDHSNWVYLSAA